MSPSDSRRFTIRDAMLLTAAAAAGLALRRYLANINFVNITWGVLAEGWLRWVLGNAAWAVLLPVTAMLGLLRLLGPRPARRRLFRPPGVAACFALIVAASLTLGFRVHEVWWAYHIASACGGGATDFSSIASMAAATTVDPRPLATAIAATWIILALGGHWNPEPSWIDRAGRLLGVYWLAAALAIPLLLRS